MAGISNLSKEQIDEYKEAFDMFDLDKNGEAIVARFMSCHVYN